MKYAFIRDHSPEYKTRILCRMMNVHPSEYYAWLKQPKSKRKIVDECLVGLIKQFWLESRCIYGYRKIFRDLRENGEICGKNRVHRLMKNEGINSQVGYKRPRSVPGPASQAAENILQQEFTANEPNQIWVTDILIIQTHEGWLYLCVALDLFSRKVVGWSMQPWMKADIVLKALLMAVW